MQILLTCIFILRTSFVIKLILFIYFSIGLYFYFSVMYDLMASSNLTPWPQKRLQCLVSSLFWMDKVMRWRNNSGKTSPWERMNENLHTWFAFFSLVKTNASTEHNRWKVWFYFDKMFFLRWKNYTKFIHLFFYLFFHLQNITPNKCYEN